MRNFRELKEHVLTQHKETENLEKRFDEMITRMDDLERNMSELMELKNTIRELRKACTSLSSQIDQAQKKGYQRSKINSMKSNEKARLEKKAQKGMNKVSKKYGTM